MASKSNLGKNVIRAAVVVGASMTLMACYGGGDTDDYGYGGDTSTGGTAIVVDTGGAGGDGGAGGEGGEGGASN